MMPQLNKLMSTEPLLTEGRPTVAAQWHPTRNTSPTPDGVTCGSQRYVWWLCSGCSSCSLKHEWQAKVSTRALLGNGCPVCGGQKPCLCNSLARKHPQVVAAEWDAERNGFQTAGDLLPQSNKPVHWRCTKHQPPVCWTATPRDRFGPRATGCPECGRRKGRRGS